MKYREAKQPKAPIDVGSMFPELLSVLRMWGTGGVDTELSPFEKVRNHVLESKNAYIETLLEEANTAYSMADDVFPQFGTASFYKFRNAQQMRALLEPIRAALKKLRDERYASKRGSPP